MSSEPRSRAFRVIIGTCEQRSVRFNAGLFILFLFTTSRACVFKPFFVPFVPILSTSVMTIFDNRKKEERIQDP